MKKFTEGAVNFKLSERERRVVDELADGFGITRSDVLRALVRAAEAKQLVIAMIPRQQAQHANQ